MRADFVECHSLPAFLYIQTHLSARAPVHTHAHAPIHVPTYPSTLPQTSTSGRSRKWGRRLLPGVTRNPSYHGRALLRASQGSGEIFLCAVEYASCLTGCQSGSSLPRLQDSWGKKWGGVWVSIHHIFSDSARHVFALRTSEIPGMTI